MAFKEEFIIISKFSLWEGFGEEKKRYIEVYRGRFDISALDTAKKMNATNEDA